MSGEPRDFRTARGEAGGEPRRASPTGTGHDARRRIIVTHTQILTFDQAEVDAVWNSGVLPIPDYVLTGDEATDPDARAFAVFTALDGSLLERRARRRADA